jgi:hypothetical protein
MRRLDPELQSWVYSYDADKEVRYIIGIYPRGRATNRTRFQTGQNSLGQLSRDTET